MKENLTDFFLVNSNNDSINIQYLSQIFIEFLQHIFINWRFIPLIKILKDIFRKEISVIFIQKMIKEGCFCTLDNFDI